MQTTQSIRRQQGALGMIMGILLLLLASGVILSEFSKTQNSALEREIATRATNSSLDQAFANFVAVNKRLPCPASPTHANGLEDATTPFATCTSSTGVLPWGALGLTFDDALDKWGRKLSYRVYSGTTGFTQLNGLNANDCNTASLLTTTQVAISASGLCSTAPNATKAADFYTGKGLTVNDKGTAVTGVAYVVISHGATGYGSYGADNTSTRSTLPNAAGNEYINTTAPPSGIYWILSPSGAGSDATSATFFDDAVSYKGMTELILAANMQPRDWGWVTLSQAFSPTTFIPNATPAQTSTLTITLTNSSTNVATLLRGLTNTFPANIIAAPTPAASTTCGGAAAFIVIAAATSISLPAGRTIPAATIAGGVKTNGTCTVTVNVTSSATAATTTNFTNTINAGSSACSTGPFPAVSYLCTDAGWNLNAASANVTATLFGPVLSSISPVTAIGTIAAKAMTLIGSQFVTGATVTFTNLGTGVATNIAAAFVDASQLTATFTFGTTVATWSVAVTNPDGQTSGTQSITITALPSIATDAAALIAAGFTLASGVVTNPAADRSVTLGTVTITPSAAYSPAFVAATTDGIGVGSTGGGSGTTLDSTTGLMESLRFENAVAGSRYLGLKLASFTSNNTASEEDDELATITFYGATGVLLRTRTLQACNASTADSATSNFFLDVGDSYKSFVIAPIPRKDGADSTLRVGSFKLCTDGPALACTPPLPSVTTCP